MDSLNRKLAPGGPGISPRWTRAAKAGVGTAYSGSSRVWYTVSSGVITEVYYPTIDTPQLRDLQYLVTDGRSFFHDERRDMNHKISCISESALGFELTNSEKSGQYILRKTIIGDPHQSCVLVHTVLEAEADLLPNLRLYALCAPHLQIGGWHNNGEVFEIGGRKILLAHKEDVWLALGATVPFARCSCGFVGVNDGWTDLKDNYAMDWEYEAALDGNIALTGEIDISQSREFTLGLAFGATRHNAVSTLMQSLSLPFEKVRETFVHQWDRTASRFELMKKMKGRDFTLFERSVNLLLAHEDKTYSGAMIAALSIPWGEDKGDEEVGGYHLVWTRDMVSSADALLAVGDSHTPLRALIYLAVSQREDGSFYQNFWIDGRPYWHGRQLDEVAFPIMLAWRLREIGSLDGFDPLPMILRGCGYLIREGPTTPQDRWEEAAGYSPASLATNIAALICGAEFIEERGDRATAEFVRDYADFLESHVERWTVTTQGSLVPGISRYYIRINPGSATNPCEGENPNCGTLVLANRPPGHDFLFEAKNIVDAGFLHLVRYGIRKASDPIIEDSVRVVDAVLKTETPSGPCWRRYNHDGYGQRDDGSSFNYWGKGRPWPLLTGERGHYELAAGRDPRLFLDAMERFSYGVGLIPEQIWDGKDAPHLRCGGPTGSVIPLVWAHSEYIKLLRSTADQKVFDLIEPVRERYQSRNAKRTPIEVWKRGRQVKIVAPGTLLRVQAQAPFTLRWTDDEWKHVKDTPSTSTALGIDYVDITVDASAKASLRFTFFWSKENRWDQIDHEIKVGLSNPK
jgi:glucoamylase